MIVMHVATRCVTIPLRSGFSRSKSENQGSTRPVVPSLASIKGWIASIKVWMKYGRGILVIIKVRRDRIIKGLTKGLRNFPCRTMLARASVALPLINLSGDGCWTVCSNFTSAGYAMRTYPEAQKAPA